MGVGFVHVRVVRLTPEPQSDKQSPVCHCPHPPSRAAAATEDKKYLVGIWANIFWAKGISRNRAKVFIGTWASKLSFKSYLVGVWASVLKAKDVLFDMGEYIKLKGTSWA